MIIKHLLKVLYKLEKFLNLFHAFVSQTATWVLNISKAWCLWIQSSVQLDLANNKYTIF